MFIEAFIDGAARNQGTSIPTEAACACVVYKNKKEVVRFARGLGNRTNNQAEYEALITALLICTMSDFINPTIYSDSSVVVNHVNGIWQCRSPDLLPLYLTVKSIREQYPFQLIQVPRAKVFVPDELCNYFLDNLKLEKEKLSYLSKEG